MENVNKGPETLDPCCIRACAGCGKVELQVGDLRLKLNRAGFERFVYQINEVKIKLDQSSGKGTCPDANPFLSARDYVQPIRFSDKVN